MPSSVSTQLIIFPAYGAQGRLPKCPFIQYFAYLFYLIQNLRVLHVVSRIFRFILDSLNFPKSKITEAFDSRESLLPNPKRKKEKKKKKAMSAAAAIRWCAAVSAVILFFLLISPSTAIYCDEDDCYDLLGSELQLQKILLCFPIYPSHFLDFTSLLT